VRSTARESIIRVPAFHRAGRRSGLTLLEVVLAISLVLAMMGAVYAFYFYAMDVRKAVGDHAREACAERLIMDRTSAELRAARSFRFLQIGMVGRGDEMQFITARVPSPAVWVTPEPGEDPVPPEHDLQLVGYRLRIPKDDQGVALRDEEGNIIIEGLERTCQKVLTAPRVEEGETFQEVQQVEVSLLSPHIKFLNLSYWTGDAWTGGWQGGDLPVAVRITMGTDPLGEEMDVEEYLETHETFERVVYLPAAAKAAPGDVSRRGAAGPGGGGGGR